MASKNTIEIEDVWLRLEDLKFPPQVTAQEVEKILIVKPIRIRLDVSLPTGASASGFDYHKNPEIRRFKTNLEAKVAAALGEIALEDDPKEGKDTLKDINSFLEKTVKAFRAILRETIAKNLPGNYKANEMMTAGSIVFDEIDYRFGIGDSDGKSEQALDLTKAFKRLKKDQHLGVAWKANKILVSVRLRKRFRDAELKELRELLPEGAARGAKMVSGIFHPFAKGNVQLRFEANASFPHELLLRKAFKKQTGRAVNITLGEWTSEDAADEDNEEKRKKPNQSIGKKAKKK